jgi:hypothetical protein
MGVFEKAGQTSPSFIADIHMTLIHLCVMLVCIDEAVVGFPTSRGDGGDRNPQQTSLDQLCWPIRADDTD